MERKTILGYFKQLFEECKTLRKRLIKSSDTREKFYAWLGKRKELEAIENKINEDKSKGIELDWFDKEDLRKIVKIIYSELVQLIPPRKRKNAGELLKKSSIPSDEINWERLNAVPSAEPLAIVQGNRCATCSKEIKFWNIFNKQKDDKDNQFCSKKCFEKFYLLLCDKCQRKIEGTYYYSNDEKKEGSICFDCAAIKCLECSKTIVHSIDYSQEFLPGNQEHNSEKQYQEESHYSPVCKSCQLKKNQGQK